MVEPRQRSLTKRYRWIGVALGLGAPLGTASSRASVRALHEPSATRDVVVGKRNATAAGLTVMAIGLAAAVMALFGTTVFLLFAVTLPAPLMLLWLSVDAVRSDERVLQ